LHRRARVFDLRPIERRDGVILITRPAAALVASPVGRKTASIYGRSRRRHRSRDHGDAGDFRRSAAGSGDIRILDLDAGPCDYQSRFNRWRKSRLGAGYPVPAFARSFNLSLRWILESSSDCSSARTGNLSRELATRMLLV